MSQKDNKEVMLKQVAKNPFNLQCASDRLRNDKDLVLSAMEQTNDQRLLQFAGNQIRDDKDFILAAVKKNGWNLQHASERLKNDLDVVYQALLQKEHTHIHIGDELKKKIGDNDPIKYIETALHKQQLERELAPKTEVKQTKQVSKI